MDVWFERPLSPEDYKMLPLAWMSWFWAWWCTPHPLPALPAPASVPLLSDDIVSVVRTDTSYIHTILPKL